MNNHDTPLHEGMRHCPVCKRPNIFTERDRTRPGGDTAHCHYCRAPFSISGKPPVITDPVLRAQIAELMGVPEDAMDVTVVDQR